MSTKNLEIELKFSLYNHNKADFLNFIKKLTSNDLETKQLFNTYFETTDNLLRKHDCGLRIRGFDDKYEMTLKTAAQGPNGLLKRDEYNYAIKNPELELELFPKHVWPESVNLSDLKKALQPQFTTDFSRTLSTIEVPSSHGVTKIEVALDEGVIFAGVLKEPLCEIELELKEGPLEGLFILAQQLLSLNVLRLSELTKAARGYRLNYCQQNGICPKQLPLNPPQLTAQGNINHYILEKLFYLEESFLRNMLDVENFFTALTELNNPQLNPPINLNLEFPHSLSSDSMTKYLYSSSYNQFKLALLASISHS